MASAISRRLQFSRRGRTAQAQTPGTGEQRRSATNHGGRPGAGVYEWRAPSVGVSNSRGAAERRKHKHQVQESNGVAPPTTGVGLAQAGMNGERHQSASPILAARPNGASTNTRNRRATA